MAAIFSLEISLSGAKIVSEYPFTILLLFAQITGFGIICVRGYIFEFTLIRCCGLLLCTAEDSYYYAAGNRLIWSITEPETKHQPIYSFILKPFTTPVGVPYSGIGWLIPCVYEAFLRQKSAV